MSKANDIPQDVWDKAIEVVDDLDPFLLDSAPAISKVARAILAEREACAVEADHHSKAKWGGTEDDRNTIVRIVSQSIAAAIRQRGEP